MYLRRRKRHLIFDVLYKVNVIFFRFIQFHLTVSLAHSIDTPRPLSHFTPNFRRGFAVRSIAGLLKCVYEYAATYRNYFNIQFDWNFVLKGLYRWFINVLCVASKNPHQSFNIWKIFLEIHFYAQHTEIFMLRTTPSIEFFNLSWVFVEVKSLWNVQFHWNENLTTFLRNSCPILHQR